MCRKPFPYSESAANQSLLRSLNHELPILHNRREQHMKKTAAVLFTVSTAVITWLSACTGGSHEPNATLPALGVAQNRSLSAPVALRAAKPSLHSCEGKVRIFVPQDEHDNSVPSGVSLLAYVAKHNNGISSAVLQQGSITRSAPGMQTADSMWLMMVPQPTSRNTTVPIT